MFLSQASSMRPSCSLVPCLLEDCNGDEPPKPLNRRLSWRDQYITLRCVLPIGHFTSPPHNRIVTDQHCWTVQCPTSAGWTPVIQGQWVEETWQQSALTRPIPNASTPDLVLPSPGLTRDRINLAGLASLT